MKTNTLIMSHFTRTKIPFTHGCLILTRFDEKDGLFISYQYNDDDEYDEIPIASIIDNNNSLMDISIWSDINSIIATHNIKIKKD